MSRLPIATGSYPNARLGVRRDYALHRAAAEQGSRDLLRRQLRTGQHNLFHAAAIAVGRTVGLGPDEVRPVAGDPTINNGAMA